MVSKTAMHYVAYMDILGYREFLKNNPEDSEEYLQTILNAIHKVKGSVTSFRDATNMFHIDGDLKLRIFSDNILLCLPVGKGNDEVQRAIVFLLEVASIQRGLILEHGLLVRGGVTMGELFINEDMVFGQGLVDAVELEAKAEFPCIVVSVETQKFLSGLLHDVSVGYQRIQEILQKEERQEQLSKEEQTYLSKNLESVSKGVYRAQTLKELIHYFDNEPCFLNYLFDISVSTLLGYKFAEYLNQAARKEPEKFAGMVETTEDYYGILLAHKERVLQKVKENCHYENVDKSDPVAVLQQEKIIRKYVWLLRYHINMCQARKYPQGLFAFRFGCDEAVLRLIVEVDA